MTTWGEGATKRQCVKDLALGDFPETPIFKPVLLDTAARNIVWKTPMPAIGNAQPLVIGDRVITTAEPWQLICTDVNTGRILWIRELNPFELLGLPEADVDNLTEYVGQLNAATACTMSLISLWGLEIMPRSFTFDQLIVWRKRVGFLSGCAETMINGPLGHRIPKARELTDKLVSRIEALTPAGSGEPLGNDIANLWLELGSWLYKEFNFYPVTDKPGIYGWTYATPVTDGEFIYVSMGQGQVACYDLNGNRVWARLFKRNSNGSAYRKGIVSVATDHCASPRILCTDAKTGDGYLLAQVTGNPFNVDGLHCLDMRTGETLWSSDVYLLNDASGRTPGLLTLTLPDGSPLPVVASIGGLILRARDGKPIGEFTEIKLAKRPGMVSSDFFLGNRWYYSDGQQIIAAEMTAVSEDEVGVKQLWRFNEARETGNTTLLCGDYIYRQACTALRLADGSPVRSSRLAESVIGVGTFLPLRVTPPIAAGKYILNYEDATRTIPYPVVSQVAELLDDGQIRMVEDENVFDGEPIPPMPDLEKHLPGYTPGDIWDNNCATPLNFASAPMAAQGNRLFLRSHSFLYCIGNPKQSYDWNPSSRPDRITARLKAAEAEAAKRTPIDLLGSPHAFERQLGRDAIAEIRDLPAKQAQLSEVASLAASTESERIACMAAELLKESAPSAAHTLPTLQQALEAHLAATRARAAEAILEAIRTIDINALTIAASAIEKAFDRDDTRSLILACRLAGRAGAAADSCTPALVRSTSAGDETVKLAATRALRTVGVRNESTVAALSAAAKSSNNQVVLAAVDALGARDGFPEKAVKAIAPLLAAEDVRTVERAIKVLSGFGAAAKAAEGDLLKALKSPRFGIAEAAAGTLLSLDGANQKKVVTALAENIAGRDQNVAMRNMAAMGSIARSIGDTALRIRAMETLSSALRGTRNPGMKTAAAQAIAEFGADAKYLMDVLREAAMDPNCKNDVVAAMKTIDPKADVSVKDVAPVSDIGVDMGLDSLF